MLLLHTACSPEEKEALESAHLDLFDAVTPKDIGAIEDVLSVYAHIVELSGIAEELYSSVEADVGRLMGFVDHVVDAASQADTGRYQAEIARTAHTIADKCHHFPKTARLVQVRDY